MIDLGVDVPKEKFVEAYEANPDTKLICCSALLTTTMNAMKETVALLNGSSFRGNIKVMVGGAPISHRSGRVYRRCSILRTESERACCIKGGVKGGFLHVNSKTEYDRMYEGRKP